ncbi:MAG TPA: tetratricopeptide repeat protein [Methanothrix sp.]|nr:tetratricopeptide repeat protein [Methanothrix sp.]
MLSGIEIIESLERIMSAFSGFMTSMLTIAGTILIFVFFIMFIRWLTKDEDGMIILPFEVAAGSEGYSGKAISQHLTAELLRIRQIHETNDGYGWESESRSLEWQIMLPSILIPENLRASIPTIKGESLTNVLSNLGSVPMGTIIIPLGPIIEALKQIYPWRKKGYVITGSLEEYGSTISLVACLENHEEMRSWEVISNVYYNNRSNYEIIPELLTDLAFKIVRDLSDKEITAKTWQGFKHFTNAFDNYHEYCLAGNMEYLNNARRDCLKAVKAEPKYERLLTLLHNLGLEFADKKDFSKAEEMFLQAINIKSGDYSALILLGYFYLLQDKYDQALKYCKKSVKIKKDESLGYYLTGLTLHILGRKDEAITAYENAIKNDPNDPSIHVSLASLYRKHGMEEKKVDHCNQARALISIEDEYDRAFFEEVCGRSEEAIRLLRIALEKNLASVEWLRRDVELEFLRDDPRFSALLDEFSEDEEKEPE